MDSSIQQTDITLEHATPVEKTIQENVNQLYNNPEEIEMRIMELNNEWDIERALQLNASAFMLGSTILGLTHNKKWFGLSLTVAGFLMNHSLFGWCPPLPVLRALGFRNRAEIDKEKYALKALRGDFNNQMPVPNSVWNSVNK